MYEEKNRKIRENGKATRERRSHMDCRVFSVKIQENRLSKAKSEKLKRCFLEAKWLYNAVYDTAVKNSKGFYQKAKRFFETNPEKLKRKDFVLKDTFKGEQL